MVLVNYSFQNWFDFGAEDEGNWNKKVIAQEKEASVLKTLHSVSNNIST